MADWIDPDRLFDFADDPPVARTPVPGAQVVERVRYAELPDLDDSDVHVDYLGQVAELLRDCERIRRFAMKIDKRTGSLEVFNPILFEKAVARRQSILSSAVKLHAEIISQHAQEEFYRLVVSTISQESKPAAHRLITALREINSPLAPMVVGAL